jgi:hypothetical protein
MIITRRTALALFPLSLAAAPGEFWSDKPPAEWSEKDIRRLLTKSPWAKEVDPDFNMGEMGGAPGMGGPPPGGAPMGPPPGGAPMGGPPGGGMGGPPQFKIVVRWESALPVREASKKSLPAEAEGHYVLSISGMPAMGDRPGPGGGGAPPADFREQMLARMKGATLLQPKGRNPLQPDNILPPDKDGAMLVLFPIGAEPIKASDKEVVFQTKMGPLDLSAKFVLKDMLYRGQLAL